MAQSYSAQVVEQREYDDFEQYYEVGKRWAIQRSDLLVPLYCGKPADKREFERRVHEAFDRLNLAAGLPTHPKSHVLYRSDSELARRRFTSGTLELIVQKAMQQRRKR